MSTANPPFPITDPDLKALLDKAIADAFAALNCHQWGIIQAFDATKQTATVKLAGLCLVPVSENGATQDIARPYPLLTDVPVFIPSGGTGFLTFPITAGDLCLVLFNDRDFDAFWASGAPAAPNSPRLHDLSDGMAIVGFRTKAKPLAGYDTAQTVLALGTTKVVLGNKVGIANQTISALTVLTNLITTLKGWTDTHGDTPNPATIAALNNVQTDINNLFQ